MRARQYGGLYLLACVLATVWALGAHAQGGTMLGLSKEGDQMVVRTMPRPVPGAGEVLIRVRAAGVNPIDWKLALGLLPGPPPAPQSGGPPQENPPPVLPKANANGVPGFDASGVIVALGGGVSRFKVGDEVLALLDARGAYAQYAVAPATAVARKPAALSFEQAAGLPTAAFTAWATLVFLAKVRKGQRMLIQGGAGGVGSAAVQIAKARGAYVIATASRRNHEYLHSLGADETIDYTETRFEDRVSDADVVLNTVEDDDTATRSIGVLRRGGILVTIAGRPDAARCQAAGVICASRRMQAETPSGRLHITKVGKRLRNYV